MATEKINLPCIQGQKVSLRPFTPADAELMLVWFHANDPYYQTCWPFHFASVEHVIQTQPEEDGARFIISDAQGKPVGVIEYFNVNYRNRSVEMNVMLDPPERGNGYATEAISLLLILLFDNMGMNKVSVQFAEFNQRAINTMNILGFTRDALLREHYYYHDEFFNGCIYSLLKSDYLRAHKVDTPEQTQPKDETGGSNRLPQK